MYSQCHDFFFQNDKFSRSLKLWGLFLFMNSMSQSMCMFPLKSAKQSEGDNKRYTFLLKKNLNKKYLSPSQGHRITIMTK